MALKKAYRRWIASVLAVLLVCLQLSMASYACPVSAGSGTAVMARMAGMPDCDRMSPGDSEQPQLCKAHCDRDKQTVNSVPAVHFTPAALLDRMSTRLALWLPPEAAEALPAVVAAHNDPPDGAPPVYLFFQVLRN
ncbi:hypothetical protein [Roseateles sp.]|uniref:hypothetical protein n=1 Tax=Roseateles sp. TaxID=1971397 RepID=UPI003954F3D6